MLKNTFRIACDCHFPHLTYPLFCLIFMLLSFCPISGEFSGITAIRGQSLCIHASSTSLPAMFALEFAALRVYYRATAMYSSGGAGRYLDDIVRVEDRLLYRKKLCIFDTHRIATLMVTPI